MKNQLIMQTRVSKFNTQSYYPNNTKISFFLSAILVLSLYSCGPSTKKGEQWNYAKDEITGVQKSTTKSLNVDVYLDVTTSMKGYVSPSTTNFSKLMDDIEATCQNAWEKTDIKYFKFGRSVLPISRTEFVSGKNSTNIFSDPQLSTQTNFAGALQNTNASRLSILITDFFYNNSDINLVVNAIKDSCIKKNPNVEIGVIGLTSTFNGIVGDVSPAVSVKGERPLYVILFGEKQNIAKMFDVLKNKPYINGNQLFLITENPVQDFTVDVKKDPAKNNKIKIAQGNLGSIKDYGTVYGFRMDAKEKEALLDFTITLTPTPFIASITTDNLKYSVYKKTAGKADSTAADDELKITDLKQNGNTITGKINLNNNDGDGKYSYAVYFGLNNTNQPKLPAWIENVNTETFAQGVNENKTLNLSKLLDNISTVFNTVRNPKIAKFFIHLEKN